MIIDRKTNFVYFSSRLKDDFNDEFLRITAILDRHKVGFGLLDATKDIWCRDYMPIQVNQDKFVRFVYDPDYLKDRNDLKSDPKEVCRANKIFNTIPSRINLDGGNVVKSSDKVILTDRIFDENKGIPENQIIKELENLFEAQIIIIPQINSDLTGHSDGMVRFIDSDKLLINELKNEYKYYKDGLLRVIKKYNLDYLEVPWFKSEKDSAVGIYINFLEVGDLLLMPVFGVERNRDDEAVKAIKESYPGKKIEVININNIGQGGGLLNCISWNINN